MKRMHPPRLNEKVELFAPKTDTDRIGSIASGFDTQGTRYCEFREISGQEENDAGVLQDVVKTEVWLRYDNMTMNISDSWRLVARGTNWNIKSTLRKGHFGKQYIQLAVEKGVAA